MWETFRDLSFKLFGTSLEPFTEYFENLKPDIEKSGIPLSLTEYVYVIVFCTLLTFLIEFPLLSFIGGLFLSPALAFFLALTTSLILSFGVFFFLYSYPSFLVQKRAKEIDAGLPFISIYLSSISASGIPPTSMFKILSGFREYKEIAKEASKIYRDIEFFGMNLEQAIRKAAMRTPSKEFKEMLLGLITLLSSGGNLSEFFKERAKEFMNEYRRRLESYSRLLTLMIEIYLTAIIVGSIFFIILSVVISMFSTTPNLSLVFMQFAVVIFILPSVSIGFIVLVKALSPGI